MRVVHYPLDFERFSPEVCMHLIAEWRSAHGQA